MNPKTLGPHCLQRLAAAEVCKSSFSNLGDGPETLLRCSGHLGHQESELQGLGLWDLGIRALGGVWGCRSHRSMFNKIHEPGVEVLGLAGLQQRFITQHVLNSLN